MPPANTMNDTGFRLTGGMVLAGLIGFFGVIFAANGVLVWLAVSTNSGVVVASSYKAGNGYQSEIAAAHVQAALGWRVEADIARSGPGAAMDVTVRDAAGAPLSGLGVTARLASPIREAADVAIVLEEGEVGRYRGLADTVAPGNWTLLIDAERDGARLYHSENRVLLR
jgi:nitrogen fixation protein FixH